MLCAAAAHSADPGLRSVLIQFEFPFVSSHPVPIRVELGPRRSASRPAEVPVQSTWRLVDDGTFDAADDVHEPWVYVLLEPSWLTCTGLDSLATVAGERTATRDTDQGLIDFFAHSINNFNPFPSGELLTRYKTEAEPWLYDRAQTYFNGYIRTGRLEFLREAFRAAQFYMARLYRSEDCAGLSPDACRGYFRLKNPNPSAPDKDQKYSYNECLATLYWLSGDPEPLKRTKDVVSAHVASIHPGAPITNPKTFAERYYAFALLAATMDWELTGTEESAKLARQILTNLESMQEKPLNGQPANGCLLYIPEETPNQWGFSPWMSSLLGHALLRSYFTFDIPQARDILTGLADCVATRGVYYSTSGNPPFWLPDYLGRAAGRPYEGPFSGDDAEHALDVAYLTAMGSYLSTDSPRRMERLRETAIRLLETHNHYAQPRRKVGGNWEGSGLPQYLTTPARKYNWWYKNSGAIARILSDDASGLTSIATSALLAHAVPGAKVQVEVFLAGPAPKGGATVSLSSSDPAVLTVPKTITVLAGNLGSSVTAKAGSVESTRNVTLTAEWQGVSRSTTLEVARATMVALALGPSTAGSNRSTTGNQVILDGPAPSGGYPVSLISTGPDVASVVPNVVIPEGATAAEFPIVIPFRTTTASLRIEASDGKIVLTAPLTVVPLAMDDVGGPDYVPPSTRIGGYEFWLNSFAGPGGAQATLTSSHPELLTVPATLTIPAGVRWVKFEVQSGPLSGPTAVPVVVTASFAGEKYYMNVTVGPPRLRLSSISLAAKSVKSGARLAYNQVTLKEAAPAGGITVRLKSLSPDATVPSSVTVPAGTTSAAFTIDTSATPVATPVTIVAELDQARGASLVLLPGSKRSLRRSHSGKQGGNEDPKVRSTP